MKKNVKEADIEVKLIKYRILTIAFLIVMFALVMCSIKTENELLLIVYSILIAFLVLLNLRYVIINKKMVNSVKIYKKAVRETMLHPLELYVLDRTWYHKKKNFSKNQIYAAVLYEIESGNLELTDKGIKISSKINLEELPKYSLVTLEMSLLDRIDCRKIRRLKISKLKELQSEKISLVIEDIKSNVSDNCLDKDIFYELMSEMKSKYFKEVESATVVYLTIISWICVFLTTIFAFAFYNKETLLNFYLPISLVVLLVATITSKYRERVIVQDNDRTLVFDSLNYISYLKNAERNKINDIYAYCLEKNMDIQTISIFIK